MIRRIAVGAMLLACLMNGQGKKAGKAKLDQYDFNALSKQIWEGWGTLNPANTAKYYSKDARRVFFDIAPLKYSGWSDYEAGVKKVMADYSTGKFSITDEQVFQRNNNFAWGYATLHASLEKKAGGKDEMDIRWTVVWEKIENEWLIVHEHVSAPLRAPAAPAAKPSSPAKKSSKKK